MLLLGNNHNGGKHYVARHATELFGYRMTSLNPKKFATIVRRRCFVSARPAIPKAPDLKALI